MEHSDLINKVLHEYVGILVLCHYNLFQHLMDTLNCIVLDMEQRYCGEASPQA